METKTPDSKEHRSGDYGNPDWKNFSESGNYDERRFQSTAKARRRHERDQKLLLSFLESLPPGQRILDAPSGTGRFAETFRASGHNAFAMELNFGRVCDTHFRSQTPAVQADVFRLPSRDAAFDVVVCFRLLHHLNPELVQKVLKELRRVARRGFVTFYNRGTWNYYRQRLRGKTSNRKYYSKQQITKWCREAGWTVEKIQPSFAISQNLHAAWLA